MTHDPICRECNQEPCVCARGVPATDLAPAARALLEGWDDDCTLKQMRRYVDDLRAALAAESGRVSVPIDSIARERYRVVRTAFWWRVAIGDGQQTVGRCYSETEAQELAAALCSAFLDGAFLAAAQEGKNGS